MKLNHELIVAALKEYGGNCERRLSAKVIGRRGVTKYSNILQIRGI